ncbi:magnesium transporter MgtE [Fulvitalea axinellae]|uniref:Magnesium transporter MgtE n=1 Tax=Fulvitalea axinellae TaxID=1182444 RepID=A0AAU9CU86_9BACT|nr:magnesium transporter MgtE [Fulvitalea axinellae]
MTKRQVDVFELSAGYVSRLRKAIAKEDKEFILRTLKGVKAADVSEVLEELDGEECRYILQLLDVEVGAQVIRDIDEDERGDFLELFSPEELSPFIDELDSDDAVDILQQLGVRAREQVISLLKEDEQAAYVMDLLRYGEDCAGGLMAKELIKVNLNWTVVRSIEEIRRQAEDVDKVYTLYVVDDYDKLLGRVSLKRIILASDQTLISEIYEKDILSVETFMDQEEVASIMQKYDLEVIPVVNVRGMLAGRITVDDIIDVITEKAEEDRQIMAGISEDVQEDDSVWVLSRARLPWLMIGMIGGVIAANFMGLFDGDISQIPALATFVPLITATGGNVGLQSSSLVLQSLANPSVIEDSLWKRLFKTLTVAILNGSVLAGFVFLFNWLSAGGDPQGMKIAVTVSTALFSVVMLASTMGTVTPIVMDRLKINPALASGPFITIVNDLLGLGVYFGVAHLVFY